MSAPSITHESRVAVLATLASLAGASLPGSIGRGHVPDVVRLSTDGHVAFIGDAKASESAENPATRYRLYRYFRAARRLVSRGTVVRIAICHGESLNAAPWERVLVGLAHDAQLAPLAPPESREIDPETIVTSIDLAEQGGEQ